MKSRLTLSIDEELFNRVKAYAKENDTTVSLLVETYLKSLIVKKPNIVDLVKILPPHDIDPNLD